MKGVIVGCAGLLCLVLTESAPAAQISIFPTSEGGWHLGTIAVGNLDADAQLEIVVPYRNLSGEWYLDAFKFDGTRLPGFPYSSGGEEISEVLPGQRTAESRLAEHIAREGGLSLLRSKIRSSTVPRATSR